MDSPNQPPQKRLSEIDFLRGIAIILVLFSHHYFIAPLYEMGWVGVDLFFVLSGFLVSGLLFHEYRKYETIDVKRFLIRRGFKIYPAFYFSVIVTTAILAVAPHLSYFPNEKYLDLSWKGLVAGFLIEALFLQSYLFGFWGHHWSLAIEEHFYILLSVLIWFLVKKDMLTLKTMKRLGVLFIGGSLALRIATAAVTVAPWTASATHLRLDGLFCGVMISYFYHFHPERLAAFYRKYRLIIIGAILPLVSFTAFGKPGVFTRTIGFSMVAAAAACLVLTFISEPRIGEKISRTVSRPVYKAVAGVGFYSYGIYLFHAYVVRFVMGEKYALNQYNSGAWNLGQVALSFTVYVLLSLVLGIGLSKLIEIPFLKLRDKYFPRQAGV